MLVRLILRLLVLPADRTIQVLSVLVAHSAQQPPLGQQAAQVPLDHTVFQQAILVRLVQALSVLVALLARLLALARLVPLRHSLKV